MRLQGPSLLQAYRARNMIMKQWVESSNSSNIVFIDFDSMSLSRHAPPICMEENWHYQCFLTWPAATNTVRHTPYLRLSSSLRTAGISCKFVMVGACICA